LSNFLLTYLYDNWVLFPPLQMSKGNAEIIKVLKFVLVEVELNSIKLSEWRESIKSLRMYVLPP
jgi:hypothetical protein